MICVKVCVKVCRDGTREICRCCGHHVLRSCVSGQDTDDGIKNCIPKTSREEDSTNRGGLVDRTGYDEGGQWRG